MESDVLPVMPAGRELKKIVKENTPLNKNCGNNTKARK